MSEIRTPASGWLVVGAGRHVDRFGLPGLARARGASAVALCGSDPGRTAELAARHGVAAIGSSMEELLADPRVTHVYVSSRNDDHERHVALAAAAGKPVLCEKPLAGDVGTAQRIVADATGHGIPFGTAFHLRHNAAHRAAKRMLQEGAIGRVLHVGVSYFHVIGPGDDASRLASSRDVSTPSRGAMAGTGAHAVDLARWFAGDAISRVSAELAELDETASGPQRVIQISGTTGSGVLVELATGRLVRPINGITVTGESGTLTITGSIGHAGGGRISVRALDGDADTDVAPHDVYAAQFEHFVDSVAAGTPPEASGADGIASLRVVESVDRALTTHESQNIPQGAP